MAGVRFLDDARFDHRQVETGRHPVVEESAVTQRTLVVVEVFLVERPAEALHRSTLHLTLDVARMNRLAGILRDGDSEQMNFAGIGIDFDIDARGRESRADAARIDTRASGDRSAGAAEARRELFDRRWRCRRCGY